MTVSFSLYPFLNALPFPLQIFSKTLLQFVMFLVDLGPCLSDFLNKLGPCLPGFFDHLLTMLPSGNIVGLPLLSRELFHTFK